MKKPWQQQVFEVSVRKKEKWNWAKPHLQRILTPEALCLDIGSGVGTLSQLEEELGGRWEFTETDKSAADETRKVVKGPVYEANIFDPTLKPNTYDVITIFDVIEHVPDPSKFLHRAHELLRPNGHIILTTPADDGTYYFWRRLAENVFGIDKDAHDHVVEGFSRSRLKELIEKNHMELVQAKQFSFAFTEMVELLYNGAYILKNRSRQKTRGYNVALSPASSEDVTRHKREYALLRIVYPVLRGISLLDHILPVKKGYEWGVVSKRPN